MMEAIKTLRGLDKERRDDMGKAGRRFYMEHLSFEQGVRKFEHLMLSMTRRSS
jgi:glycosyltransferase involved in cell wall biosynthesis